MDVFILGEKISLLWKSQSPLPPPQLQQRQAIHVFEISHCHRLISFTLRARQLITCYLKGDCTGRKPPEKGKWLRQESSQWLTSWNTLATPTPSCPD